MKWCNYGLLTVCFLWSIWFYKVWFYVFFGKFDFPRFGSFAPERKGNAAWFVQKIYFLYKLTTTNQIWRFFCRNNSLSQTNFILFCCRYVDGQDYMESVANAIMKVANTSQSLIFSFENLSKSYLYCFSFENIFSEKEEESQMPRQKRRFSSQTGG